MAEGGVPTQGTEDNGEQGIFDDVSNNNDIEDFVKQLECANDEDDMDQDDDGGEGDEVLPAPPLWSALQSASYMTAMHQFVHEKHRVQNILAAELAQAEKEMESGDAGESISIEGDIELYTPEQQRKRRANKKSPGFLSGVIRLWNSIELTWSPEQRFAPPTADDGAGSGGASDTAATAATTTNTGVVEGIGKSSFVDLMVKVQHLVLTPPVDPVLAERNALQDWVNDSGGDDEAIMTYEAFVDSFFELVDTWTETSEEKEYAELSNMIADGITVEDPVMKTNEIIEVDKGAAGGRSSKDQHDGRQSWTRRNANPDIPPLRHGKLRMVDPLVLFKVSKGVKPGGTATACELRSEDVTSTHFAVDRAMGSGCIQIGCDSAVVKRIVPDDVIVISVDARHRARLALRRIEEIVYDPRIAKEPVSMDDLQIDDGDESLGDGDEDMVFASSMGQAEKAGILAKASGSQHASRTLAADHGRRRVARSGGKAEKEEDGDEEEGGQCTSSPRDSKSREGRDHNNNGATRARGKSTWSRSFSRRLAGRRRERGQPRNGAGDISEPTDNHLHSPKSTLQAMSRVKHTTSTISAAVLSADRVLATIAKVYLSKIQVDEKLLSKGSQLSWTEKNRRKKHERMDRFVLQYHIRQFGTRKLARRTLHQFCQSVTRLALQHPRIEVFADLIGVPIMVRARPYAQRMREYQPFACSNFALPLLTRVCPPGEKLDRWMGNGKMPVTVSANDFLLALREVCPHVPVQCPPMVHFTLQLGKLTGDLEKYYTENNVAVGKRPNGWRSCIDLDAGLLASMPLWTCEGEHVMMQITLRSVDVIGRWVSRLLMSRRRAAKEAGANREPRPGPTPGDVLAGEKRPPSAVPSEHVVDATEKEDITPCVPSTPSNGETGHALQPGLGATEEAGLAPRSVPTGDEATQGKQDHPVAVKSAQRSVESKSKGERSGKRKTGKRSSGGKSSAAGHEVSSSSAAAAAAAAEASAAERARGEAALAGGEGSRPPSSGAISRRKGSRTRRRSSSRKSRDWGKRGSGSQSAGKSGKRSSPTPTKTSKQVDDAGRDEVSGMEAAGERASPEAFDKDATGHHAASSTPTFASCVRNSGRETAKEEPLSPLPKQRLQEARDLDRSISPPGEPESKTVIP